MHHEYGRLTLATAGLLYLSRATLDRKLTALPDRSGKLRCLLVCRCLGDVVGARKSTYGSVIRGLTQSIRCTYRCALSVMTDRTKTR